MSAIAISKGFADYAEERGGIVKAMDRAKGFLAKAGITVETTAPVATEVNPFARAQNVGEVLDLIVAGAHAHPRATEGRGNPIVKMLKNLSAADRLPVVKAMVASGQYRNDLSTNHGKGLSPLQFLLTVGDAGAAKALLAQQRVGVEDMKVLVGAMGAAGPGGISAGHKQCLEVCLQRAGQAGFEKMLADPSVRDEVLKGGVMRAFADTLGKVGMRWPEVPEGKPGVKLG